MILLTSLTLVLLYGPVVLYLWRRSARLDAITKSDETRFALAQRQRAAISHLHEQHELMPQKAFDALIASLEDTDQAF